MHALHGVGLLGAAFVMAALVGCSEKSGSGTAIRPDAHHHAGQGHDHAHEHHSHLGPHGGHLIELGEEAYHAELMHDDQTHSVTIYLLDGQVKQNVAIEQPELTVNIVVTGNPRQFKLAAAPQPSDTPQSASRFQSESEDLCAALDEPGSRGRFNVNIHGKHFVGEIEQHEHDRHGHEQSHQADRRELQLN